MNYQEALQKRILHRKRKSALDFNTKLKHFSIVSFKVDVDKLASCLPRQFKSRVFQSKGERFALISAVGFQDADFGFKGLGNFPWFQFYQTNFRAYIVDAAGNDCAWFFGTTLGSWTCAVPKYLWKMPWSRGNYSFQYETEGSRYLEYKLQWASPVGNGLLQLQSSDSNMEVHEGFDSVEQQLYILTHPVTGYYYKRNAAVGTYQIWHPEMQLHEGKALNIQLDLFENSGLIAKQEMESPHSVLLTPSIEFDVLMPPK